MIGENQQDEIQKQSMKSLFSKFLKQENQANLQDSDVQKHLGDWHSDKLFFILLS